MKYGHENAEENVNSIYKREITSGGTGSRILICDRAPVVIFWVSMELRHADTNKQSKAQLFLLI